MISILVFRLDSPRIPLHLILAHLMLSLSDKQISTIDTRVLSRRFWVCLVTIPCCQENILTRISHSLSHVVLNLYYPLWQMCYELMGSQICFKFISINASLIFSSPLSSMVRALIFKAILLCHYIFQISCHFNELRRDFLNFIDICIRKKMCEKYLKFGNDLLLVLVCFRHPVPRVLHGTSTESLMECQNIYGVILANVLQLSTRRLGGPIIVS